MNKHTRNIAVDQARPNTRLAGMIGELREVAVLPFDAAEPLPGRFYHDEELAAFERETLFRRNWICLGREDAIPNPGDFLTHHLDGEPVFAIRLKDGSVATYSNVCLHRNSTLVEGCGHAGSMIACPYHAWTYDPSDGRLRRTPFADIQNEPACKAGEMKLRQFRTECWGGWILATINDAAAPVAEQLEGLETHIFGYHLERYKSIVTRDEVWEANWKALAENFIESYHIFVVHRESLEQFNPTRGAWTVEGGSGFALHFCPITENTEGAWGAAHPQKTGVRDEDRRMLVDIFAFPGFLIVCTHNWIWWMSIQPAGAARVHVRYGGCVTPEVLNDPAYEAFPSEFSEFLEVANSEDKRALRWLMAGTSGDETARGRLAPLDRPIWEFIRYLDRQLSPVEKEQSANQN